MKIVKLRIERFRAIREAELFPDSHNVYLGPNNIGKTAVLEALNLLLSPEATSRREVVDENDFFQREYLANSAADDGEGDGQPDEESATAPETNADGPAPDAANSIAHPHEAEVAEAAEDTAPEDVGETSDEVDEPLVIHIEAVITGLDSESTKLFSNALVPWDEQAKTVIEFAEEGDDPFEQGVPAIRPCFEAWYDAEEDEFAFASFLRTDPSLSPEDSPRFTTLQKRAIGFLIYRDFRALQRPITLERAQLFNRLVMSREASPRHFESVISELRGSLNALLKDKRFAAVLGEYKEELRRYLPLSESGDEELGFESTDLTRTQVKNVAQLHVEDQLSLPIQKMGAGTRSLAILAMLVLIARRRGRGIIALEEPETFLFPHAQRRVIEEVMSVADQTFVTSHSPFILEDMPVEAFQRLDRDAQGVLNATRVVSPDDPPKELRQRFKRQLCEALLGRAAIVVEEDSIRLWLQRASRVARARGGTDPAYLGLESHGIAVVPATGNGDVSRVAAPLKRAGLTVVALLDAVSDEEYEAFAKKDPSLPTLYLRHKGLEDLIVSEVPRDLLERFVTEAPYTIEKITPTEAKDWESKSFRDFLRRHKTLLLAHEWLIENVPDEQFPASLVRAVELVEDLLEERIELSTASIVP